MSFKRDGDDVSQLNTLKKRRVAELFAHNIPDDEALLMSSGRYACTVCHYRPVFDTLQMLTIHRQGKKHQRCLESHYKKKRDYMQLVEKRKHENYIKNEEASNEEEDPLPLLSRTSERTKNVLLKATPYNSCVKWGRPKSNSDVGEQKSSTDLFFSSPRNEQFKEITETEQYDISKVSQSVDTRTSNEHAASKFAGIRRNESTAPNKLMPYIAKSKRNQRSLADNDALTNKRVFGPVRDVAKIGQPNTRLTLLNAESAVSTPVQDSQTPTGSVPMLHQSEPKGYVGLVEKAVKSQPVKHKQLPKPSNGLKGGAKNKQKEVKRILQLTSSGWIRDRGGSWVKDEDVEFDSDEDVPTS